jgi:hypothetical protein
MGPNRGILRDLAGLRRTNLSAGLPNVCPRSRQWYEYIRDLIRREQERGAEIKAVRAALIEGETSGKPKRLDANAFKRKIRRAHG